MIIKTFEGNTMQEALTQARDALGDEAIVLNTRQVKAGGLLGLRGGQKIEVTAAIDDSQTAPAAAAVATASAPAAAPAAMAQVPAATASPVPAAFRAYEESVARGPVPSGPDPEITQLKADIRELRSIVSALLNNAPSKSQSNRPLVCQLGVDEDVAADQLAELVSITDIQELTSALAGRLEAHSAPPELDRRRVIAVVGPTGVGKTTTLAKLAARFALQQGKSVALVTADTYRIGAVDQLKTYARIMNLPLEIALSPEDVTAAVAKHGDKDVVLIDTVGRSQRSEEHIRQVREFVDAAEGVECYLVVSASQSPEVQREVAQRFAVFSPSRLAITKIDESPNRGCIVNLPHWTGARIACVTAGQNVPQDIEFADAARLATLVTEVA
jgi:flagellar biosynthesis protein FlhF